jgi:single-stranded DNA-specific DHH superfamily exonuclease
MANQLFKDLAEATGLPQEIITKELNQMVSAKGIQEENLTLDEFRLVMAEYLREVLIQAKNKFEEGIEIEEEVPAEDLKQE